MTLITRLGLDNINLDYLPTLSSLLKLPNFVGMLGGKSSSAHYFVGIINDYLIYLDPHKP